MFFAASAFALLGVLYTDATHLAEPGIVPTPIAGAGSPVSGGSKPGVVAPGPQIQFGGGPQSPSPVGSIFPQSSLGLPSTQPQSSNNGIQLPTSMGSISNGVPFSGGAGSLGESRQPSPLFGHPGVFGAPSGVGSSSDLKPSTGFEPGLQAAPAAAGMPAPTSLPEQPMVPLPTINSSSGQAGNLFNFRGSNAPNGLPRTGIIRIPMAQLGGALGLPNLQNGLGQIHLLGPQELNGSPTQSGVVGVQKPSGLGQNAQVVFSDQEEKLAEDIWRGNRGPNRYIIYVADWQKLKARRSENDKQFKSYDEEKRAFINFVKKLHERIQTDIAKKLGIEKIPRKKITSERLLGKTMAENHNVRPIVVPNVGNQSSIAPKFIETNEKPNQIPNQMNSTGVLFSTQPSPGALKIGQPNTSAASKGQSMGNAASNGNSKLKL